MIYKLILSTKEEIKISHEEYIRFKENISSNFIELDAGIINPSFVVSVIIDEELSIKDNNDRLYLIDKSKTTAEEFEPIRKIFSNTDLQSIKEVSRFIESKINKLMKTKNE
jgi:hypothetical protein